MNKSLSTHLLLDMFECDRIILNDCKAIESILLAAAKEAKTTVLHSHFHKFSPQGVSGFAMIAESHLSIHTWPEDNFAAADIFVCGDTTLIEKAKDYFIGVFKPRRVESKKIDRGNHT